MVILSELSREFPSFITSAVSKICFRYEVSFVDIVLPVEELRVGIKHIGIRQGNFVVKVETFNSRDQKVIEGTAEIAQPTTAYVFNGQGPQEPGIGMELYNNSPAARAVWDAADAHLLAMFSAILLVSYLPHNLPRSL
jgi:hypothetical protein